MQIHPIQIGVGIVIGIYVAQTYDVPNIKKLGNKALKKLKEMEKDKRKEKENKK